MYKLIPSATKALNRAHKILCPLFLACLVMPCHASFTIYTSEANFLAAVTASGTDKFDDLHPESTPTPLNRTAGSFTYTASSGPIDEFYPAGIDVSPLGGDVWLSTYVAEDNIHFSNFSKGVSAIGGYFFATDDLGLAANGNTINITAVDDGSFDNYFNLNLTNTQHPDPIKPTDSSVPSFFGLISNHQISSLTVQAIQPNNQSPIFPTINNLTLASTAVVPVPAAAWLMATGLIGLMVSRKNK